jgi:hypothetical protein
MRKTHSDWKMSASDLARLATIMGRLVAEMEATLRVETMTVVLPVLQLVEAEIR